LGITPFRIFAILDQCYKLTIFTKEEEKKQTIQLLYNLYEIYKPESMVSEKTLSELLGLSSHNFFLNIINSNLNSYSISNLNFEEVKHYLNTLIDVNLDSLLWWKSHQDEFLILSKIAYDYLVIQLTSIASEQAFSITDNTIIKTCNRLYPETVKTCLCLKSWIQNGLLKDKDTEKKNNVQDEIVVIEE